MQEQQRRLFPHSRPVRHEAGTLDVKKEPHAIYQHTHDRSPSQADSELLLPIPGKSDDVRGHIGQVRADTVRKSPQQIPVWIGIRLQVASIGRMSWLLWRSWRDQSYYAAPARWAVAPQLADPSVVYSHKNVFNNIVEHFRRVANYV